LRLGTFQRKPAFRWEIQSKGNKNKLEGIDGGGGPKKKGGGIEKKLLRKGGDCEGISLGVTREGGGVCRIGALRRRTKDAKTPAFRLKDTEKSGENKGPSSEGEGT